jgi:hypothetical protein
VALISKKRVVYALVIVVVALSVLSFVLPYLGGAQHGISP